MEIIAAMRKKPGWTICFKYGGSGAFEVGSWSSALTRAAQIHANSGAEEKISASAAPHVTQNPISRDWMGAPNQGQDGCWCQISLTV